MSSLEKEEVAFDQVLTRVINKTRKHAETKNVRCEISPNNHAYIIFGNTLYLNMMLNNLIANAITHAQTQVHIALSCKGSDLCLTIHDDGVGIAQQYHEDVFKPFFRVPEQTNQGKENHYGLGLAISQRIIEMHNGHLTLNSKTVIDNANTQERMLETQMNAQEMHSAKDLFATGTELLISLPLK
jgi:signal transduction histidine kinase